MTQARLKASNNVHSKPKQTDPLKTLKANIKKAIRSIKIAIKEEEKIARQSDKVWGCCDKSLSEGLLDGLYTAKFELENLTKE